MKKIKFGLLPRILVAIVLGVALGGVMPEWGIRVFLTFNGLFSQLLGFLIPLIIVGMVIPAIADIGRGAGRMLLYTVLLAYASTIVAGLASYFTGALTFPSLIDSAVSLDVAAETAKLTPYFTVEIAPLMSVMTALVLAFMVGLGLAYLKGDALRNVAKDFGDLVTMTIESVIIPLLPLYIFGIFLDSRVFVAVELKYRHLLLSEILLESCVRFFNLCASLSRESEHSLDIFVFLVKFKKTR